AVRRGAAAELAKGRAASGVEQRKVAGRLAQEQALSPGIAKKRKGVRERPRAPDASEPPARHVQLEDLQPSLARRRRAHAIDAQAIPARERRGRETARPPEPERLPRAVLEDEPEARNLADRDRVRREDGQAASIVGEDEERGLAKRRRG